MREDWTGFYGPAYRLMLQHADRDALPQTVWDQAIGLHRNNPVGEGHWEFLALGYLHLFDRDKALRRTMAARLVSLLELFSPYHPTANWRLMAHIVRCRVEGHFLAPKDLQRAGVKQADDGFLPDIVGDNSSQYHAFIMYLIMRFSDPFNAEMRSVVIRALEWLTACHHKYGDPSPLGRGRFQLFGYASMAAAAGQAERWQLPVPTTWHVDVWSRLDGNHLGGAISRKWDGPHRSFLLHGYNTIDDYPAFTALLTRHLIAPMTKHSFSDDHRLWWHQLDESGSGLVADMGGVLVSVLVSPHQIRSLGIRTLLRKAFRPAQNPIVQPQQVMPAEQLPGCGIHILKTDEALHLNWVCRNSGGKSCDMTLWSPLPMQEVAASGSVEPAHLEWRQGEVNAWTGLGFHSSRVGTLEMRLKRI